MRQFWLLSENDKNFLVDLQEKDAFGADPEGLGIQISSSGYRAGTDIVYYNDQPTYENLKFTMVYGAESEEPYNAFATFIHSLNGQKLVLAYRPDDGSYDPDHHFVPQFLWDDDIDYPTTVADQVITKTITQSKADTSSFSFAPTANTIGPFSKTDAKLKDGFTTIKVTVKYGTGTTTSKAANMTFKPGTQSTGEGDITFKSGKKNYKIHVKGVYNGGTQVAWTCKSKNVKLSKKSKFYMSYSYTGTTTNTYTEIIEGSTTPSVDAGKEPTKTITTKNVVPLNGVASITLDPTSFNSFSLYSEYVSSGGDTGFISVENEAFSIGSYQRYLVTADTRVFEVTYNGITGLTIECTNYDDISKYNVTVTYSQITYIDDLDSDTLELMAGDIYFRNVKFVSATKGEIEHDVGWLKSDLTLAPETPWYRWEKVDIGGTSVDSLPVDTTGSILLTNDLRTLPMRVIYQKKAISNTFSVNVLYYDIVDTTKQFSSKITFDKQLTAGTIIEINSDFANLTARYSTDGSKTWNDLMPYLSTSGVGFARVKANGVSYLDFKGTTETFNKNTDQLWYRKEMVVV